MQIRSRNPTAERVQLLACGKHGLYRNCPPLTHIYNTDNGLTQALTATHPTSHEMVATCPPITPSMTGTHGSETGKAMVRFP